MINYTRYNFALGTTMSATVQNTINAFSNEKQINFNLKRIRLDSNYNLNIKKLNEYLANFELIKNETEIIQVQKKTKKLESVYEKVLYGNDNIDVIESVKYLLNFEKDYIFIDNTFQKNYYDKINDLYLLVHYCNNSSIDSIDFFIEIYFLYENTQCENAINLHTDSILKFQYLKKCETQNRLYHCAENNNGLYLIHSQYKKENCNLSKDIFNLSYNDDILEKYDYLLNSLDSNKSGLYFLRGLPGTGKSYFIKYLIFDLFEKNENKKIILIDVETLYKIIAPASRNFLLNNKDSIFIIEDAESVLLENKNGRSSLLSGLLNLSDGIFGDLLNMKFLMTFNADIKSIDKAATRSGRLMFDHEFKKLNKDKANSLSEYLECNVKYDKDIALCDIFCNNMLNEETNKKIGF